MACHSSRRRFAAVLSDQHTLPYQCSVAGHRDILLNFVKKANWRTTGELSNIFDERE